jgi:hypothetical protein
VIVAIIVTEAILPVGLGARFLSLLVPGAILTGHVLGLLPILYRRGWLKCYKPVGLYY